MVQSNKYDAILQEQIQIIKECQIKNSFNSCLKCPQLIKCEIRIKYIQAVYKSMNKGATGGFEF